jgi:glycosyltransferase involved in cell wall biosynthesis
VKKPRVVLLRGHHTNVGEFRPWELLQDRFEIVVLVTGSNEADIQDLRLPKVRVRARRDLLPRSRMSALLTTVPGDGYLGLDRHLTGASIVHSAELGPWFSRQPALLKERLGFKFVLTVWETIPFRTTYRTFRARTYRAETIPQVDLFLATTERARQCLLLEDVPGERIEVCSPGIDRALFAPGEAAVDEHVILSAARLVWEKGHQDVLRAIAALERGLVPGRPQGRLRVVLFGAGPEEEVLARYADDLGIRQLVEFARAETYAEVPEVFTRSSCVVLARLPTRHWEEQFGMVLVEAMSMGIPIIASASGAIPEVFGDTPTLFPAGDWMALARALADGPLVRAPGSRVTYDANRVKRYSIESAAERIADAYDRVLAP